MDELAGIELRHLAYFAAVAEAGTVTEAARRLMIAQPSLSQQIRALERRVGAPMFRRLPQGMELTEAGRGLLDAVHRSMADLRSAVAAARGVPRELRLGVCLGVADAVLRRAEALLGRVSIVQAGSAEQVELLSRGELAVGLVRLPVEDPGLAVRVVSDEPLGVVLAADHPLARHTVLEWAELAGQRLLWFPAERAPGYAAQVLAHLEAHGWRPEPVVSEHSSHTLFRHALRAHSDLVALRPRHGLSAEPGLTWRAIAQDPPREKLALVTRRDGPYACLPGESGRKEV